MNPLHLAASCTPLLLLRMPGCIGSRRRLQCKSATIGLGGGTAAMLAAIQAALEELGHTPLWDAVRGWR